MVQLIRNKLAETLAYSRKGDLFRVGSIPVIWHGKLLLLQPGVQVVMERLNVSILTGMNTSVPFLTRGHAGSMRR